MMKTISTLTMAVILVTAAASASAWWNQHREGDHSGKALSPGYQRPYWGYAPYNAGPVDVAPVLTEEQRAAILAQQNAFAEQRQIFIKQAVTAQREFAKRFGNDPFAVMETQRKQMQDRFNSMAPAMPSDIAKRIEAHNAEREALVKEREARRNEAADFVPGVSMNPAEHNHRLEESRARRNASASASEKMNKRLTEAKARRDEKRRQMEAHRNMTRKQMTFDRSE